MTRKEEQIYESAYRDKLKFKDLLSQVDWYDWINEYYFGDEQANLDGVEIEVGDEILTLDGYISVRFFENSYGDPDVPMGMYYFSDYEIEDFEIGVYWNDMEAYINNDYEPVIE